MPDAPPRLTRAGLGLIALMVALFAILAAAAWLVVRTWIDTSGSPMSIHGYIAMTLGIVFSLIVGCGLMSSFVGSNLISSPFGSRNQAPLT